MAAVATPSATTWRRCSSIEAARHAALVQGSGARGAGPRPSSAAPRRAADINRGWVRDVRGEAHSLQASNGLYPIRQLDPSGSVCTTMEMMARNCDAGRTARSKDCPDDWCG